MKILSAYTNITLVISIAFANISLATPEPTTLLDKLCSRYENLDTISCDIRKISKSGDSIVRLLSHVLYKKGGFLNVDCYAPFKRRIMADGENFYYYQEGSPKGFSCPLNKLKGPMLASLNNVPATPMENLVHLKGIDEQDLPATDLYPQRRGYQTKNSFVVISLDSKDCPVLIELFKSPDMSVKLAQFMYENFTNISENCWIPLVHKAVIFNQNGVSSTETRRVSNLAVNGSINDNMFKYKPFFKDVVFTGDFDETLEDTN